MIQEIMHVGVTVSNLDRSIAFYRDILGLTFQGEILMEGKETDLLFGIPHCKARVAYLNGSDRVTAPPVELIQFVNDVTEKQEASLTRTSISEICFMTDDIEREYEKLTKKGVECLSAPQFFDFTKDNMGKSRAIYFKDPDGIILELMQPLK